MKIVLWGINYPPEPIGIAPFNHELCRHLAAAGHEVTAVTAFAYYPFWRKTPADAGRWRRTETLDGIRVERCWCYVPGTASTVRRIVHELSFGLVSFWRVLWLDRPDVYVVISPPLVLGFFAWLAARLKRSRYHFHVQDLQPDAAVGLGMLKSGPLIRALYLLESVAYAKASRVSGISDGMMAAFAQKKVPKEKCALLPNWLRETPGRGAAGTRDDARRQFGVPSEALLAVYAGNLGRKQGLEIVLSAAELLRGAGLMAGSPVMLIIAGDGAARADLARRLAASPHRNITLLPLLEEPAYRALLQAADVALITQTAGAGQFFFPSKLLTVLAARLPVIAVAEESSELARAVHEGGFGGVIAPADAAGLATVLASLASNPERLRNWRERTAWVRKFDGQKILPEFETVLRGIDAHPNSLKSEDSGRISARRPPLALSAQPLSATKSSGRHAN